MKKSNDRRIRYTRYALQNALIVCMQQKPFNRITVREICETADINRSTFYMHYKDIYELLDEIEEQVYQEIDAIFSKESPSIHNMEQLLDYVQTHKTLLECLLQQGSGLAISRFSTILSFLHALTNIRRPMPNRIRIASILPIKASPLSCVSYWFRRVTKKLPMRSAIVCHKAITVTAMDKRFFSSFATNAP